MTTKEEVEQINQEIDSLVMRRNEIQEKCQHNHTQKVNYQWRIGSTIPAQMCSDCQKILNTAFSPSYHDTKKFE